MQRHSLPSLILQISLVFTLFFYAGCADDLRNRNIFDSGAGSPVISFSVENVTLTRQGETSEMESAIDHAYLLFYESSASLETAIPVAAVRAEISADNPSALDFKMPLLLSPNTDYQLVAIANADRYAPDGYSNYADYIQTWCNTPAGDKKEMHVGFSDRISKETVDCLPMRGIVEDNKSFRFSIRNGVYEVNAALSFRRMVARIDLLNKVNNGFFVEGVALCNWRDAVPVAAPESQLGNRVGHVRGILSDDGENCGDDIFVEIDNVDAEGVQQVTEAIYCFPSVSYEASPSDKESTALIVKAKYGEDTASSYYRVNVGSSANKSEVMANKKYVVTIQSVTGRGAATPLEAYMADESLIELSIVEDWDLEGCFAMDDKGNFIVLSTGSVEFEGNNWGSKEVKVLSSKNLELSLDYVADNEDSEGAFRAALSAGFPLSTIMIAPVENNTDDNALSGRYVVTAVTPDGGSLKVDLNVIQKPAEGGFQPPVIPDEMPFALVPQSYDRVKIDHVNKTIEIDGFDPDCFNSFIDIPFKVYIKASEDNITQVSLSSNLQWPLEGGLSKKTHNGQIYCSNSFVKSGSNSGMVFSQAEKKELNKTNAIGSSNSFTADSNDYVYISVGAMAPDDPAICREVILSANGESVKYSLTIKPASCIIDDIVIIDESGQYWLVQDRNVVNLSKEEYLPYIGLNSEGRKYQAHNSSKLNYPVDFCIPGKYNSDGSAVNEKQHELFLGTIVKFAEKADLASNIESWLKVYKNCKGIENLTPFFEQDCDSKWRIPDNNFMLSLMNRIKVSKMRMFLVSDVPAKKGKKYYSICCYLPYMSYSMTDLDTQFIHPYFVSDDGKTPNAAYQFYFNEDKSNVERCLVYKKYTSGVNCLTRLVRQLSQDEFKNYEENYLGYSSKSCNFPLCYPDTYDADHPELWIPL